MLTGSRVKNDAVSGCSSLLLQGTEDREDERERERKGKSLSVGPVY